MKGDFTRFTFNKDKHFTRVLKQQGRVDLDADWNEQSAIEAYQRAAYARDEIGASGAPRDPFPGSPGARGSFAVYFESSQLRIAPGHFYVDGLLCELANAVGFSSQPYSQPPAPVPGNTERDFIYLDAWERHITAVEDPGIREVALGGPDTATRVQTVWQARARRLTSGQAFDCKTGWQALVPPAASGRLSAWVDPDPQPGADCEIAPGGGYRGLENRLYRVEIHKSGNSATASFKWSRDNGAVLYPAATVSESGGGAAPRRVRLLQSGRDALLSIRRGDWVEVTSDTRDLALQSGTLTQVDDLDQAGSVLVLADDVSTHFGEQNLKVRRWDQPGPALALSPGPILLEEGIHLSFTAGSYTSGDYWTFAARAAVRDNSTGEIEALSSALPHGIQHHYAPLGLVTWQLLGGGGFGAAIDDCRPVFPPLNDLRAADISFDNSACQIPGADTVQEALDQLCQQREGACTFVVKAGQNLQAVFDLIPAGGDASICFQAGSFSLDHSVTVKNKGRLKLSGAGTGTHLIANKVEAALVFESCESVLIRDLSAESRAQGAIEPHLNGVLTFLSCDEVHVEAVELSCSHATDTMAACLAVRPAGKSSLGSRSARVIHNHMHVGNDQAGILLVNVDRAQVEDNLLEVIEFSGQVKLSDLVSGRRSRAKLSRILFSNAQASAPTPAGGAAGPGAVNNATIKLGDLTVNFLTNSALRKAWQPLFNLFPAQQVTDAAGLQRYVNKLADKVLVDDKIRTAVPTIRDFINGLLASAAAAGQQGIVVAGSTAAEIRVLNNTILGLRQGVHVGLSHREGAPGAPDAAASVTVANNQITCRLTFDSLAEARHGIFVGNCASLLLENNRIRLDRRKGAERYEMQGIELHGFFGPRLLVKANHLSNFRVGIQIVPLGRPLTPIPPTRLWIASENLAEKASTVVQAPATVIQTNNSA